LPQVGVRGVKHVSAWYEKAFSQEAASGATLKESLYKQPGTPSLPDDPWNPS
jgi:hypothetical protein